MNSHGNTNKKHRRRRAQESRARAPLRRKGFFPVLDQDLGVALKPFIDRILDALEVDAYVTVRSNVSDFRPDGVEHSVFFAELGQKLGVPVNPEDSVVDLAMRLRKSTASR